MPATAHAATETIDLQPSSKWAVAGSGVGPPCTMPPSPQETDWADTANDGVTLSVAGTDVQCCDCIRRSAVFTIGQTTVAGAHLTGTFSSTNAGMYADGTFRVILLSGTSVLGHKVYATQQRANNNCAGSSEEPETIVNAGAQFDIDLTTLDPNGQMTFDTIQLEVLGYACPTMAPPAPATSATSTLSGVTLTAPMLTATMVGPTTPGNVMDPFGPGGPGPFDSGYGGTGSSSGGFSAGGSSSGSTPTGGGKSNSNCAMGQGGDAPAALLFAAGMSFVALGARRRRRRVSDPREE